MPKKKKKAKKDKSKTTSSEDSSKDDSKSKKNISRLVPTFQSQNVPSWVRKRVKKRRKLRRRESLALTKATTNVQPLQIVLYGYDLFSLEKELPLDDVEPCMQGLVTADIRADIMYRRQLAEQVAESFGYRFNVHECLY